MACSTGEEAYTLAIMMENYLARSLVKFDYHIDASDVDIKSVEKAKQGRYRVPEDSVLNKLEKQK